MHCVQAPHHMFPFMCFYNHLAFLSYLVGPKSQGCLALLKCWLSLPGCLDVKMSRCPNVKMQSCSGMGEKPRSGRREEARHCLFFNLMSMLCWSTVGLEFCVCLQGTAPCIAYAICSQHICSFWILLP